MSLLVVDTTTVITFQSVVNGNRYFIQIKNGLSHFDFFAFQIQSMAGGSLPFPPFEFVLQLLFISRRRRRRLKLYLLVVDSALGDH